jgi:hypothetical protein
MNYYHKSYRILSRSVRDTENKLFRALVTIETSPGPVYYENTTAWLEPPAGGFENEREAESFGVEWGILAIDQGFMEGKFFRRLSRSQ